MDPKSKPVPPPINEQIPTPRVSAVRTLNPIEVVRCPAISGSCVETRICTGYRSLQACPHYAGRAPLEGEPERLRCCFPKRFTDDTPRRPKAYMGAPPGVRQVFGVWIYDAPGAGGEWKDAGRRIPEQPLPPVRP